MHRHKHFSSITILRAGHGGLAAAQERRSNSGGGRRIEEHALDVVLEAHVGRQFAHVVVRRPPSGRAAGRVPGLEVGAVYAERLQDLGDGAVDVVHVVPEHWHGPFLLGHDLGQQQLPFRFWACVDLAEGRLQLLVHAVGIGVEVGDRGEAPELYRREVVGPGRLFLGNCMQIESAVS